MGEKLRVPRIKAQHKDNAMEVKHSEHLRAELLKEEMRHKENEKKEREKKELEHRVPHS